MVIRVSTRNCSFRNYTLEILLQTPFLFLNILISKKKDLLPRIIVNFHDKYNDEEVYKVFVLLFRKIVGVRGRVLVLFIYINPILYIMSMINAHTPITIKTISIRFLVSFLMLTIFL